jgi:DNA-binding phage protein
MTDRKPPHASVHPLVKAAHAAVVSQGLSIEHVARRSGVRRETIHRWFSGESDPFVANLEAVLNAAGLRIVVEPIAGDQP